MTLALLVALLATLLVNAPRAGAEAPWTSAGNMSVPRVGHTATKLPNGKVLVTGGYAFGAGGYEYYRSAEIYDPAKNSWRKTANMSVARAGHTATLLPNGKVLVVGGTGTDSEVNHGILTSAELFDPTTNTWSNAGELNVPRSGHTVTLLNNGFVLIAGGQNLDEDGLTVNLKSAELYSSDTGFASIADMASAHMQHTATLLRDGSVLIVGGQDANRNVSDVTERYVFNSGWTSSGVMDDARSNHTAVLLPNGEVMVAGGYVGNALATPATEFYNLETGWRNGMFMPESRYDHTVTVLASGEVITMGGYSTDGAGYLASTLAGGFPGGFATRWSMTDARAGHRAVLLNDGSVLVVGGFSGTSDLASAERWLHSTWRPELTRPVINLKTGALTTFGAIVNVRWTAIGPGLDSIQHMEAELRTNGGAWQSVSLPEDKPLSIDMPLQPGSTYQFRVRGIDWVGGIGEWATSASINLRGIQDSSAPITFTSGWKSAAMGRAWGGTVKFQTSANARASFAFTGSRVAFVSATGPDRGKAQILIDGAVKKTVDLYTASLKPGNVMFVQNGLSDGPHTIEVKVLGTEERHLQRHPRRYRRLRRHRLTSLEKTIHV